MILSHVCWPWGSLGRLQQFAGLRGFARVLSSPGDRPGLGKGVWEGRAWARRKDASLPATPRELSARTLGEEK